MVLKKNKSFLLHQRRVGYWFIFPSMIVLLVFVFTPLIMAVVYSFMSFNMMFTDTEFVKFENYIRIISDDRFWNATLNTFYYMSCMVPMQVIVALLVAVALKKANRFNSFLRSVYFVPVIVSMTVVAIIWSFLINNDYGIYTYFLRSIGIDLPDLLNSTTWAMPTIILIGVWKNLGFKMIILIAGLQGISQFYYESAEINGASAWQTLTKVTIPLLMPTITFVTIDSVISSFQVFDQVYVMTRGGPLFSTETLVQYVYNNAFIKSDMGYASTVAVALLVITLLASIPLYRYMKRGEDSLS